jgi:hypothetical protein
MRQYNIRWHRAVLQHAPYIARATIRRSCCRRHTDLLLHLSQTAFGGSRAGLGPISRHRSRDCWPVPARDLAGTG